MTITYYMTVAQTAKRWGISVERVRQYIYSDRIRAVRIGRDWMIHRDEPRPEDRRRKD